MSKSTGHWWTRRLEDSVDCAKLVTMTMNVETPTKRPEPQLWLVAVMVGLCTLAVLMLFSCGKQPLPPISPQTVSCYGVALDRADKRAQAECQDIWEGCQYREAILDEMTDALEECDAVANH